MARLTAAVARLSGSVQWTTVGSGAITGDVAKLSTGVALHGLGLAITSKVVGTTALVAGGRTGTASKAATETTSESSARGTTGTTAGTDGWVGAGTLHRV